MWEPSINYNDKIQKLLDRSKKLLAINQFSAARDLYERILKYQPKDEIIQFKIAETYFAEKNAEMVEKWCKESLKSNPKFLQPLTMLGLVSAAMEKRAQAISYFEKALKMSKNNPEVIAQYGRAFLFLGDEKQALDKFTLALEKDSKITEAWTGLTFFLFFSEGQSKAIKTASDFIKKEPNNPFSLVMTGFLHSVNNEVEEAMKVYSKVKEKAIDFPIPWDLLAENCLKQRKLDDAQLYLEQAVQEHPDHELFWSQLAFVYKEKELTSKVADALEQVIRINPGNMRARMNLMALGRSEDGEFDIEESMRFFDRAFKLNIGQDDENDEGEEAGFNIRTLFQNQEYDKIISHCKEILEKDPNDITNLMNLANAYENKEMFKESIDVFEKIAELDQNLSYPPFRIASLHVNLGEYAEALRIYDKLSEESGKKLNLEYAQLYKSKGEFDKAIEYLKQDYDPSNPSSEIEFELAEILIDQNKSSEALDHLETAFFRNLQYPYFPEEKIDNVIAICKKELPKRDNKSRIQVVLGILYAMKREYPEAQNYFEDAIKSSPSDSKLHEAYGYFFRKRMDYENAAIYFDQALSLDEDKQNVKLTEDLAECYKSLKNYEKALEIITQIDEEHLSAEDTSILNTTAEIYEKLENLDKAEEYYRKSIDKSSKKGDFYLKRSQESLAKLLVEKKNFKEAAEIFEKLLEKDPNNSSLLFELGGVYDELGQGYKARECYDKCIENDSGSLFRLQQIAQKHFENKRHDKTIEVSKILIEAGQATIQTLVLIGFSYFSKQNYDQAKKHLEDVLELDYNTAIAHSLLGEIYYMKSDLEEAAFYYRRFIEIDPEEENALNRLSEIYEQLGDKEKARELYLKSMGYD